MKDLKPRVFLQKNCRENQGVRDPVKGSETVCVVVKENDLKIPKPQYPQMFSQQLV